MAPEGEHVIDFNMAGYMGELSTGPLEQENPGCGDPQQRADQAQAQVAGGGGGGGPGPPTNAVNRAIAFQRKAAVWKYQYAWAHRCCNQFKSQGDFCKWEWVKPNDGSGKGYFVRDDDNINAFYDDMQNPLVSAAYVQHFHGPHGPLIRTSNGSIRAPPKFIEDLEDAKTRLQGERLRNIILQQNSIQGQQQPPPDLIPDYNFLKTVLFAICFEKLFKGGGASGINGIVVANDTLNGRGEGGGEGGGEGDGGGGGEKRGGGVAGVEETKEPETKKAKSTTMPGFTFPEPDEYVEQKNYKKYSYARDGDESDKDESYLTPTQESQTDEESESNEETQPMVVSQGGTPPPYESAEGSPVGRSLTFEEEEEEKAVEKVATAEREMVALKAQLASENYRQAMEEDEEDEEDESFPEKLRKALKILINSRNKDQLSKDEYYNSTKDIRDILIVQLFTIYINITVCPYLSEGREDVQETSKTGSMPTIEKKSAMKYDQNNVKTFKEFFPLLTEEVIEEILKKAKDIRIAEIRADRAESKSRKVKTAKSYEEVNEVEHKRQELITDIIMPVLEDDTYNLKEKKTKQQLLDEATKICRPKQSEEWNYKKAKETAEQLMELAINAIFTKKITCVDILECLSEQITDNDDSSWDVTTRDLFPPRTQPMQQGFPKPDIPSLQNFKFSAMPDGSIYVEEISDKFNGLKISSMPDGSFFVELK